MHMLKDLLSYDFFFVFFFLIIIIIFGVFYIT